ncbi:MAG: hypothetical protein NC338_00845, partial [Firmicutes bacterium]|nr:hypothetical protein [Bacillota bacterium]MCM1401976.1 hypothetical protein [Bacteroides sp.]MCM1477182.1 hypothetical protein [Bacteroides sp.]
MNIANIIAENALRNRRLTTFYDPISGRDAGGVRRQTTVEWEEGPVWLPVTMLESPEFPLLRSRQAYMMLRFRHDFDYWCATCITVRQKRTGNIVPLILNAPQRKVVAEFEADRLAGRPIRIILLKARQWGGSLLYIYSCIYKWLIFRRQ